MEPLEVWVDRAARTTPSLFARDNPHPALVFKGTAGVVAPQSLNLFKTQAIGDGPSSALDTAGVASDVAVAPLNGVYPLVKRPDGPYPERISIGRARTNDVPINFPRISKLHALLTWSSDRSEFFLTDMETTNGTTVDNLKITPKVAARVPDRAEVSFGPYRFVFNLPQSLYVFLRSLV